MDTDVDTLSPLKRALVAIEDLRARLARAEGGGEPVAIVGMGCRLPGGVDGPEGFWDLLREGRDGVVEVPAGRWNIDAWYEAFGVQPGDEAYLAPEARARIW